MELPQKRLTKFLYVIEAVGAVFVGIFLIAYLGGLPTTAVLHSEPAFRIPLFILGAVLVELAVGAAVAAALLKH
ncbi:MAG: hypothetical protein ACQCN4_06530 [Candidatus Bathyarchaeia archaeon]